MQTETPRPIDPRVVLILGIATASGALCVDMYLPAFPVIAQDLKTTPAEVQLSLVSYFVTLAIGQLFYGPVSDRIGRKGPMLFGFLLLTIASIGCALSTTPGMFIGFRALQGAGACGAVALGRAIVRDLHTGADAAKVLSLVMLVLGVSPVLAPLLGSALLHLFSWRASFWFITIVGGLCFLMVTLFLKETLEPERRTAGVSAALASRAGKPLASTPNIERIAAATLWFYGSKPPGQLPYGSGVFAFATILLLSLGVRGLGRK